MIAVIHNELRGHEQALKRHVPVSHLHDELLFFLLFVAIGSIKIFTSTN